MRMLRFGVLAMTWLGCVHAARADSQPYESRAEAERAAAILRARDVVHLICTRCSEPASDPVRYRAVTVVHAGEQAYEVRVDGERADADEAYVWHDGAWRNLAALVGFEVPDAPRVLPEARLGTTPPRASQPVLARGVRPPLPVHDHCVLDGDGEMVELTCRGPGQEETITAGFCRLLAEAELGGAPGPEQIVDCSFADGAGAIAIVQDGALRYARMRWELQGQGAEVQDIVPNGDGVFELVIRATDEDGSGVVVVAMRENDPVVVFEMDLGGGMASPDHSRTVTFRPAVPAIAVRVSDERRRWTELWRWDPAEWRFERPRRPRGGGPRARRNGGR